MGRILLYLILLKTKRTVVVEKDRKMRMKNDVSFHISFTEGT